MDTPGLGSYSVRRRGNRPCRIRGILWRKRRSCDRANSIDTEVMASVSSSSQPSILGSSKIVAFAGVRDADRARAFYRDTLGLRLVSEDGFALVFDANGNMLRVSLVREVVAAPYTVL